MTKKRKSRARKSSVSNEVSKSQTSPADHELSPTSQANQVESEEEQSHNTNVLEPQNSPVFVRDNNVDQSENLADVVQLQSPLSVVSGEATTSFASRERQVDQEQRQLEVGLSQIASFSKKNPVF